jgi:hypothetical protein
MTEIVKIDLRIPRKSVFLLTKVIERGLLVKDKEEPNDMLNSAHDETLAELLPLISVSPTFFNKSTGMVLNHFNRF